MFPSADAAGPSASETNRSEKTEAPTEADAPGEEGEPTEETSGRPPPDQTPGRIAERARKALRAMLDLAPDRDSPASGDAESPE